MNPIPLKAVLIKHLAASEQRERALLADSTDQLKKQGALLDEVKKLNTEITRLHQTITERENGIDRVLAEYAQLKGQYDVIRYIVKAQQVVETLRLAKVKALMDQKVELPK